MSIRLLIVDDENDFVEVLAQRLQTRGFSVKTAACGEEALDCVREHDFDVVILDVMMPGLNGVETLQEIKKLQPLTEVILLTGHGALDIAIEGTKLGAYDYLLKPTDIPDLVKKITTAYERRRENEATQA